MPESAEALGVVTDQEEPYPIWPARRELPAGWAHAGKTGGREACLAPIGEVWAGMRPPSPRERMAEAGL